MSPLTQMVHHEGFDIVSSLRQRDATIASVSAGENG